MGLSIFEETFGTSRVRFGAVNKREAVTEHLVAITHAVQAVVDTFPDPNGTKYAVSMSEDTRAYTTPDTKRIVVSFKPIFDKGLRVSTACTVMLGLTLHEIGHTLYTFPHLDVFEREFGEAGAMKQRPGGRSWEQVKAWDQLAYTVLNIGDDARLEARMSARLPVAKDVFPTMLHWVALDVGMVGERLRWRGKAMSMADRVNFAGRAVRYPWTAMWSSDEATRAERSWWIAWGRDYIALADDESDGIIRLVRAALERLRNAEDVEEPEQEQDEPQGTPEPEQEAEDDEQDPDKDEPDDEPGEDEGPGPKQPGREPSQPSVEDEDEDEDEDEPQKGKDPFGDDFDKDESDTEDDDESDEDDDEDDDDWDDDDDEDSDDEADNDDDDDDDGEGNPADDDDDEADEDEDEFADDASDDEGDDDTDSDDTGDEPGPKGLDSDDEDDAESDSDEDGEAKVGAPKDEDDDDKERDFPDDFDAHDLKGNVDAVNRPRDWKTKNDAALLQKAVDTEAVTDRVKTSEWGSVTVEVRSIAALRAAHAEYQARVERRRRGDWS
jgi:hypothetical protein